MVQTLFLIILAFGIFGLDDAYNIPSRRQKLIIDHDGGADDAMAIFMCILYEKYFHGPEIVALTTTYGNVDEHQAFLNSQRILDTARRSDIPIYRGATRSLIKTIETDHYFGKDGLGDQENVVFKSIPAKNKTAAQALIELSKRYKDELIVMSIGPQTNIALAKRLEPQFVNRLKQLYIGAGNIYSSANPLPEFNALMDVEAYYIAVDDTSSDKVTTVPFSQILKTLNITNEWRENVLGSIPTAIMRAQNTYERISLPTTPYWCLLDPAVAAVVLDDAVVTEFKYSNNSIILHGPERGVNTNDLQSSNPNCLKSTDCDSIDTNVRLVFAANKDKHKQLLIDIFSAELK